MRIKVVLGSTRPGRVGERVAKWVEATARQLPDFEVELVDLADYNLPHFNEPISPRFNSKRDPATDVKRWLAEANEADGFVIVTPEYNHSFPGILKDAIDYLDFQFAKKPVAIVSYGTVGGARAAEQLKQILIEAKAAVVPEAIALLGARDVLDESGHYLGDDSNPYNPNNQLVHVLSELSWWTTTLAAGRKVASLV